MSKRLTYWPCQVLGWGLYTAIGLVSSAQQVGWSMTLVAGYVLFLLYSITLTDLLRREIRRRHWLDSWSVRTFFRLFVALALVSAIQTFLVTVIDVTLQGRGSQFWMHREYVPAMWLGVFGADCMWMLFYVSLTSKRRYQEKEVRLQLAVREAELRALEAQVDPHFLFNCLNSIRAMVVENPAVAQDMITRFAAMLRYNLQRDVKHTVRLESEVEIVSHYLALEAVRFEDRLRTDFAIEPAAAKILVPPMLLQTLVENSLKHGIARLPQGGDVRVRARLESDTLVLEVENTGQLTGPKPGGTNMGLANARERLRLLYGARASLLLTNGNGKVTATARIPARP